MALTMRRRIWFVVWLILISIPFVTLIINTPLRGFPLNIVNISYLLLRLAGMLAFTFLFLQVIIGSNMSFWLQQVGSKAYKWHISQGLIAFFLVLSHPVFYGVYNFAATGMVSEFFTALLRPGFSSERDLYVNQGRTSLGLLTLAVMAGYFRTSIWIRKIWIKMHILVYFSFFLSWYHAFKLGSDVYSKPFYYFYWLYLFAVIFIILRRILKVLNLYLKSRLGEERLSS